MDNFLSARHWQVTTDSQAISYQRNLNKISVFIRGSVSYLQRVAQIIIYKSVISTSKQNTLKINAFCIGLKICVIEQLDVLRIYS